MKNLNKNKKITTNRAVLYCRVSTKEQVDEGNSLSTQEKACKDFAYKNGYEITEVFMEQGESAKTTERTEWLRLMSYCADKKNNIGVVIAYKIDRISRNTDDYSQIRILLKRYGVEIKSTTEHFENTPAGRFMENIIANVAQFDNDMRTERCAGGMREAVREGRYVWIAPVGYENVKIDGRSTITQNSKALLVKQIFQTVALNLTPVEAVRREFINNGLTSRNNKPVTKGNFYLMLKNELYTGWINKFGERHKGNFEPIISEEIFAIVQDVLKKRSRRTYGYLMQNPDFPLRRFVTYTTGKKLTGAWSKGRSKKYPYYCFKDNANGINLSFRKETLEIAFMDYLNTFYSLPANTLNKIKNYLQKYYDEQYKTYNADVKKLRDYLEEIKTKEEETFEKNDAGVINDEVLNRKIEFLKRKRNETEIALSKMPISEINISELFEHVAEYFKNPGKIWAKADLEGKMLLQWFNFPQGITFDGKIFRTTKLSILYKGFLGFSSLVSRVVDRTGLEPATPSLQMMCSTR